MDLAGFIFASRDTLSACNGGNPAFGNASHMEYRAHFGLFLEARSAGNGAGSLLGFPVVSDFRRLFAFLPAFVQSIAERMEDILKEIQVSLK